MGRTRSVGLLVTVPRRGARRRGLKSILRSLSASSARQESMAAARAEAAMAENPIFRRAWERTAD